MNRRHIVSLSGAALVSLNTSVLLAVGPTAQALDSWNAVVATMDRRLGCHPQCTPPAVDERSVVDRGELDVRSQPVTDDNGREIHVPDATIQYWRGAIFIPRVTIAGVLNSLLAEPPRQADVLAARIVSRHGDHSVVHLRVIRRTVLSVVYDTDHDMRFHRETPRLATARSVMTRAVEIVGAGTPAEYPRPAADDRGFLWRLNSYWWYEERPNGVLAVLDSVTLSRDVPILLRPIAQPLIRRVAAESVTAALQGLRDRFAGRPHSPANDIDYPSRR